MHGCLGLVIHIAPRTVPLRSHSSYRAIDTYARQCTAWLVGWFWCIGASLQSFASGYEAVIIIIVLEHLFVS